MLEKTETQIQENTTMRPVTMDDVDAALEFFNICSIDQIGKEGWERSEIEVDWTGKDFDRQEDTRAIFDKNGKMIAFQAVFMDKKQPVHPWIFGMVHPEHVNKGYGTQLMTWAQERARIALEIVPEDVRVSVYASTYGHLDAPRELFESFGMKLIRHAVQMQVELDGPPPEPQWPEGIEIKVYKHPEDSEAVYRADDEAFQDHFGHVSKPFEEGYEEFMHYMTKDDQFDPNIWFLAMDGDEIAGFSLNRKRSYEDADTGYVGSLGVRRPWRKRGLATALLYHSFGDFYRRGKKRVALHADASNLTGAVRVYKKVGMEIFRQYDRYELELRPGKELATTELDD